MFDGLLTQPWFQVFGMFVAMNTLVYVGLAILKLIPLPRRHRRRSEHPTGR